MRYFAKYSTEPSFRNKDLLLGVVLVQYFNMMIQYIGEGRFFNPTKGELSLNEVISELIQWMYEDEQSSYEVVVASDSSSEDSPRFPVVVTIHRRGKGGRFFVEKVYNGDRKFYSFRDRIWEEAQLSVDIGEIIRNKLEYLVEQNGVKATFVFKRIHLDIGENGVTRDMINEITGFVRAHGFEPVIKPEAWAVRVADRFS